MLKDSGIEFKALDLSMRSRYAILHAKTFAIDGQVYIGGSANFTNNSCNSEENLVVVRDEKVVFDYMNWFDALWTSAESSVVEDALLGEPGR